MPCVPEGRVLGEIDIDNDRPAAFTEEDRTRLGAVAEILTGNLQRKARSSALRHFQRAAAFGQRANTRATWKSRNARKRALRHFTTQCLSCYCFACFALRMASMRTFFAPAWRRLSR